MAGLRYLLDTNILVALIRDRDLGRYLRATYRLLQLPRLPEVCVVTHGEIRSLAARLNWGPAKMQILDQLLNDLGVVDLGSPGVVAAYINIDRACHAQSGGARNLGQNDMGIAAAAQATGATLLTTDKDFGHLYPGQIQRIYIDPASTLPPPGTTP
jgi:predicted nucleic acid-binding protein